MGYLDQQVNVGGRTVRAELSKQARDQPLHWLWAAVSTFLPFGAAAAQVSAWWLAGVCAVSAANLVTIVVREKLQWPSTRWWDPVLDWAVFALGVRDGAVTGILLVTLI